MKRMLTKEFVINVYTTTIHNYLGKFAYTLKRITPLPAKRRVICATEFMDILGLVDDSNIFFVDELGFNVSMRSRRGKSLKGT